MGARHNISYVSKQTGLTTHTIRAWERRYEALSPARSGTNRRLYEDGDIVRLSRIKQLVDGGYSVSQVAGLSDQELASLVGLEKESRAEGGESSGIDRGNDLLEKCFRAVNGLDHKGLRDSLSLARTTFGASKFVFSVAVPLIRHVDLEWEQGRLNIAQEHMSSAILRAQLDELLATITPPPGARKIVVTTPKNQIHELGALMVTTVAALCSWEALYFGANLPASEIVGAFKRCGASAVALSIVYPRLDTSLGGELREIREGVGPDVPIFVGGSGCRSFEPELRDIQAVVTNSLDDFRELLSS